jgi:phasin family protein
MSTLPEQFSEARLSQMEAQVSMLRSFTGKAIEGVEKIVALNLSTSRAALEKSSFAVSQLFTAKDPRDLLALTAQTQASFDGMLAYGRQLLSIAAELQPGLPSIAPAAAFTAPQAAAAATAPAPAAAPAVEPAADVEPVVSAFAKAEPVKVEPVIAETVKAEPVKAEPVKADPVKAEQVKAEPVKAEPLKAEPVKAEPVAVKPAPSANEAPVTKSAKPKKLSSSLAPEVEVAPEAAPVAKAKPIAMAVAEVAEAPTKLPKPAASFPAPSARLVSVPPVKPIEASPPPAPVSGKPVIDGKQGDLLASKPGKKK